MGNNPLLQSKLVLGIQPVSDAAATLSKQLRAMRDLFQPPSNATSNTSTAPQQRVFPPQFPPGISLPCGPPPATLNVSWSHLNLQPQQPSATIALPLPAVAIAKPLQTKHAPVQRVPIAQLLIGATTPGRSNPTVPLQRGIKIDSLLRILIIYKFISISFKQFRFNYFSLLPRW